MELTADLTGVYPAAERVTRSLSFERGRRLEIRDVVTLRQPGEVWWFVQTRASVAPSADGRTLTLAQKGRTIHLRLLEPDSGRFELGPARPLPTSPHYGKTPLHSTALKGDLEMMEVLISHGADVNARDEKGRTALHIAASSEKLKLVEALIAAGADTNMKDKDGEKPPTYGNREIANLLRRNQSWE
ncbi:MAG: ankyrin repeat domain-containing protein [Vulcanimicrobiota bacterium]